MRVAGRASAGCALTAIVVLSIGPAAALAETSQQRQKLLDDVTTCVTNNWSPPPLGDGAPQAKISLSFELKRDGQLASPPKAVDDKLSPKLQSQLKSIERAVLRCAPFKGLVESGVPYEVWRTWTIHFDLGALPVQGGQ